MSPANLISKFLFWNRLALWSARLKYPVKSYQLYMDNFRSSMQCIQLTIYHYRFCILDLCVTWLCVCVGFIVCRNVFCSRWFVSPFAVQLEILFLLGQIPIHVHMHLIPSVALLSSTDEMIESIYASPILYLPFDL